MLRLANILFLILSLSLGADCLARQCGFCAQASVHEAKPSCHDNGKTAQNQREGRGACCFNDRADGDARWSAPAITQWVVARLAVGGMFSFASAEEAMPLNYHLKRYRDATAVSGTMALKLKQSFLI